MKLILILIAVASLCGCETYKHTGAWSPDGFNYTLSRDRQTHDITDEFGLSWTLK